MLFCTVAGPALLLVAQFTLVSMGIQVPAPAVALFQVISVVIAGPLLLAGYANYCGYSSGASPAYQATEFCFVSRLTSCMLNLGDRQILIHESQRSLHADWPCHVLSIPSGIAVVFAAAF